MFEIVVGIICVGAVVLRFVGYFMKHNKQVDPTEYVVMKNKVSGETVNYGPGMHFPGPELEVFKTLPTTVQEGELEDMDVNLAGGITMKVGCRFNWIVGRKTKIVKWDDNTDSDMFDFDGVPPFTETEFDQDMITRAAKKIDLDKIDEQVREGLKVAFELVYRSLEDVQLANPATNPPLLPTRPMPGMPQPQRITSPEVMQKLLSEQVRKLANQLLVDKYGFGLNSVSLSNAVDADQKLKDARTKGRVLELNAEAVTRAMAKLPNNGAGIDPATMALFGDPVAMAEATKANALKALADAIPLIKDLFHVEINNRR